MERILETPMHHGTLVWPLSPPARSMVLVVKGTFDLHNRGIATLAEEQVPCHGMTFFDDDPTQSPRLDTDFALVKRRGECFLAGTCHPPDAPAAVSAVAFSVGPVKKAIGVMGDRRWKMGLLGRKPTDPEPFEAMPLRWERAFGGPGYDGNPLGRGLAKIETEDGAVHPLPNLERPGQPVSTPGDRPAPASCMPIPPSWPERLPRAGTYDARYVRDHFPYFPDDFDPSFYQAAPEDQRVPRFWTGTEEITLKNLSKEIPFLTTRLPGLRARGFVERTAEHGGRFEEIPLTLDTITVDADAMRAYCLWRGTIEVQGEQCTDVARLFVMHEPVDAGRPVEACRHRMLARLRLKQIEASGFVPENPQEDEDAGTMSFERVMKTLGGDPQLAALLTQMRTGGEVSDATVAQEPEEPPPVEIPEPEEPPPAPPNPDELLDDIFGQLAEAGMDLSELRAQVEAAPEEPAGAPDPDQIREAYASAGVEPPPEVDEVLRSVEEVRARNEEEPAPEEPEHELSARERALLSYAEGRPLEGDFSDVDLSGEDLAGMVASGAILRGANLSGCNLRGAKLDRAVLARARLEGVILEGADLTSADLSGANLVEARLANATLADAVLDQAHLTRAHLDGADLTRAEARGADLSDASAEGVTAPEIELSRASLRGLRARGSCFVDARFTSADASGADLSECDLTKLRASRGARFDQANLRQSTIDGGRFRGASMRGVNLSFATMSRANLSGAQLQGAILAGTSMRKAKLIGADLTEAQIQKSDLMGANLLDANLERADVRGSSLYGAELFRTRVSGARWELADLTKTKLEGRA